MTTTTRPRTGGWAGDRPSFRAPDLSRRSRVGYAFANDAQGEEDPAAGGATQCRVTSNIRAASWCHASTPAAMSCSPRH
ncbi:homoserine O-acetyltransferase domain protein [Mycobacterium xenopi 3993]|nr:homoserine O-acetyltransferase domain protein [Mycobacterium xenopi 3993]